MVRVPGGEIMKKTWVKIKRGFLQPEHRSKMGIRVWLYMFIIDQADWDTGIIYDWTDKNAADELGMPINTLRQQRQELETLRYINCIQEGNHQRIVILKWVDPRSYSGEVMNDSESDNAVKVKGNNKGKVEGTESSVPLHSTHKSLTINQESDNHFFVGEFLRIADILGLASEYQGKQLVKLKDKYGEARLLQYAEWCKSKEMLTMDEVLKAASKALDNWKEKTTMPEKQKKKYTTLDGEVFYE